VARYWKEWPRCLLTLPLSIRLGIVSLCSVLCLAIHLLTFPLSHNGSLLAIPIGVSAWIFKKQGLFLCFTAGLAILVVYHTLRLGSLWWPAEFALFFWGGAFILLLVGLIMSTLRALVDSADAARLQAEQAQRQTALAFEQQHQLNQLKNQFIVSVNHELRTPLSALMGYLELLQLALDEQGHLDRSEHGPYLKKALRNCDELRSLVSNVLDTLKLGSDEGQLTIEAFSVAEVVADVVTDLDAAERRTHRIHLDIPEHLTVWANRHCVRHVLRHLLSNACKYTPADTDVVVSAALDTTLAQQADSPSQVCIRVKDEGPGIPQDEMPLLFGQFVRLKRDVGGQERGSGLGLYISKHLVEVMGGRMWVESTGKAGEGSRFCFTLASSAPSSVQAGPSHLDTSSAPFS
jgi:signal transduction histidine kinase